MLTINCLFLFSALMMIEIREKLKKKLNKGLDGCVKLTQTCTSRNSSN